jgi:hypothetical protein
MSAAARTEAMREFFTALGIDHLLDVPVDSRPSTGEEQVQHDA